MRLLKCFICDIQCWLKGVVTHGIQVRIGLYYEEQLIDGNKKKCAKCDLKQCNVTNSSLHHSRNEARSSVTRYNEILRDFNDIRNYMQKFVLHCKGAPTFRNPMFAKISEKNA